MEFNKGLLDTVVKAACIVELQKERDLEAQKADMFIKAVANVKHAAVSDLVDARTSVMMGSQIALEVRNRAGLDCGQGSMQAASARAIFRPCMHAYHGPRL